MPNFIPPARVRQEDESFINSLASAYRSEAWSYDTLRSIAADAMRMIRHLASRYSDPTCMELNAEELEAEGRRKFIEQITKVKVLIGLPQRLHAGDLIVAFNDTPISDIAQLQREIERCHPDERVIIRYLRWPKTKKNEDGPNHMKVGAIEFALGGTDTAEMGHLIYSEMTDELRHRGDGFDNFSPLAVVVESTGDEAFCGRSPQPPTRVELFSWLKCCANNHIRGIVHRCRFTVRRTGRKVPGKDSVVDWNRSFKPEVSLEAASEDDHLNRAVERAASVWDSHAVQELDEDMGASLYATYDFSHPDNAVLTVYDLSLNLHLIHDRPFPDTVKRAHLSFLADRYRKHGCTVPYAFSS